MTFLDFVFLCDAILSIGPKISDADTYMSKVKIGQNYALFSGLTMMLFLQHNSWYIYNIYMFVQLLSNFNFVM